VLTSGGSRELELRRHDDAELRSLAGYTEGFIDAILMSEGMAYLVDGRELLLCNWRFPEDARRELEWSNLLTRRRNSRTRCTNLSAPSARGDE